MSYQSLYTMQLTKLHYIHDRFSYTFPVQNAKVTNFTVKHKAFDAVLSIIMIYEAINSFNRVNPMLLI